ncbi:MAG: hypothetical protein ACI8XV_000808, partial [Arenicella sp.]
MGWGKAMGYCNLGKLGCLVRLFASAWTRFLLTASLALLINSSANAVVVLPGLPTGFEIELGGTANKLTDFADTSDTGVSYDWDTVLDGSLPGAYTHDFPSDGGPPVVVDSTGIVAATSNTDILAPNAPPGDNACNGSSFDLGYGMGAKIDSNPWEVILSAANNKADACSGGAALEVVNIKSAGHFPASGDPEFEQIHYVLYNYWTRSFDSTGDMTVYQILRGPIKDLIPGGAEYRCDDRLIEFNYDPSGTAVTITSLGWLGDGGALDCEGSGSWVNTGVAVGVGATGGNVDPADLGQATAIEDTFGESAIDLTASGILPEDGPCGLFLNEGYITRTGNSQTGSTIDRFIFEDPIEISNCANVEISKVGNAVTSQEFTYVLDQANDVVASNVHDTTLTELNNAGVDDDGVLTSVTSSIAVGETDLWEGIIAEIDYDLKETDLPAGWVLDNITCTYYDPFTGQTVVDQIRPPKNDSAGGFVDDAGTLEDPDTFSIPPIVTANGVTSSCVITNATSGLVIEKTIINDNGGTANLDDFNITFTAPDPIIPGEVAWSDPMAFTGSEQVSGLSGPHAFAEEDLDGYTEGTWSCVDDDGATVVTLSGGLATGSGVIVAPGQLVTCSITNNDDAANLALIKQVTNNNGGTAVVADFPLFANGVPFTSGTAQSVNAGSYALTETNQLGYTASNYFCSVNSASAVEGNSVVLALGDVAICSINNDDAPASLTLIKSVTNDNGGNAVVADFPLFANGVPFTSGTPQSVNAGSYALTETNQPGYTASNYFCSVNSASAVEGNLLDLALGDVAICTINNDDVAPSLVVTKTVTNDNGGDAVPNDFLLTAGGAAVMSGVALPNTLSNTDYLIGETLLAGYTLTGVVCTSDLNGSGNAGDFGTTFPTINLAEGEAVACTVTNDDVAPSLVVTKTVTNDNGGDAAPNDFLLTAGGAAVMSGVTLPNALSNTDYLIGETLLAGYTLTGVVCTSDLNGSGNAGDFGTTFPTINLAEGEAVVCTVTNDDIAPSIDVSKVAGTATFNAALGTLGGYDATFTITAVNTTTGPGQYSFTDTPTAPAGMSVTNVVLTQGTNATTTPTNGVSSASVTDEPIAANGTDTWNVAVQFTITDLSLVVGGTGTCDEASGVGGFANNVVATPDTDLTNNDACIDVPTPDIDVSKTAGSATFDDTIGALGGYNASYTVTAINTSTMAPGVYSYTDTPTAPAGMSVTNVVITQGTNATTTPTNGATSSVITDEPIAVSGTDTWNVAVQFTITDLTLIVGGVDTCDEASGVGAFANSVAATPDSDLTNNAACIDVPTPDIDVSKTAGSAIFDDTIGALGGYNATYTVTAINSDTMAPGVYSYTDTPTAPAGMSV